MPVLFAHGGESVLFGIMFIAALFMALLMGWVIFLALTDLAAGAGLLLLFKRRHLFWVLPIINVALFYPLNRVVIEGIWTSFQIEESARGWMTFTALACAILIAVVMASILASLSLAWRRLRQPGATPFPPTTHDPSPPLIGDRPQPYIGPHDPPTVSSRWLAFREGFAVPREGFLYLSRHPSLWRYGVVPLVLNLILSALVLFFLIGIAGAFAVYIHPHFPPGWVGVLLEIMCGMILLVVTVAVTVMLWLFLQGVLCGWSYAKLAKKVELQLGMKPEDMKDISLTAEIADTIQDFKDLATLNGSLFVLQFIPVLGSAAGLAGSLLYDWYVFGMDYLEYPLNLRGARLEDKRAFGKKHRFHVLGLGAIVFLFGFVPILGSVILTTAVAGAVLLYRKLEGKEYDHSTPSDNLPSP